MSKSFLRISALLAFLFATLTSAVLLPAYRLIGTDFVLSSTLLYDAVDLLWQWLEIFLLSALITLLVIGVHHHGLADAKPLYYICGGALLFKYVAAILSSAIIAGSFNLTIDYGTTLFAFFLEILMLAVVAFLANHVTTQTNEQNRQTKNAAKRLGAEQAEPTPLLPLTKPFAKGNPLQNVLYLGIGIVAFFRFVSFIASEIAFSMMGFAYTWADLPVSLLYLLLTVLLPSFLAYLGAYVALNKLNAAYFETK